VTAMREALPEADLVVLRRGESTQPMDAFEAAGAKVVATMGELLQARPDLAVVASPATLHLSHVLDLVDHVPALLIEKPLAASLEDAREVEAAVSRTGVKAVLGYHLRFSPTVLAVVSEVEATCGEVLGFDLRVGQALEAWRPGSDVLSSVSARRDLGGGVLLELSHELDALRYLVGACTRLRATLDTRGAPTDGLVESVADIWIQTSSRASGHVHLDMVSDPPFRMWRILGSDAIVEADLLSGEVWSKRANGEPRMVFKGPQTERAVAEANLVDHVLAVWRGVGEPKCTLADGVAALALIEASLESAASGGLAVSVSSVEELEDRWT